MTSNLCPRLLVVFCLGLMATWTAEVRSGGNEDAAVRPPGEVNAQRLDGPPRVTCKAWAIADGKTGELLWGDQQDQPRDIASTTKIMTAYIVCQLAERDASVLDQQVVVSARAAGTRGSSAQLRQGDRLPVSELLYGLLLPSGNDAAVAVAEHFGEGFCPPEEPADEQPDSAADDPLERFVAEMNRTARSLEMSTTCYHNPHGLTAKGHLSTASDLLQLAHAALKNARLRDYVATRQRSCRLSGSRGRQRNVVWKNTNRLLEMEGYHGVKTGTTRAAGACLVSCGQQGSDRLIVVVLGATSSDARYTDSRNLFRWAWLQRGHP